MERLAVEAERESIKLKQVEYINQHLGEEFMGIVSGVTAFGIFVELEETFIEGMIHIRDMTDDFYIYDEATFAMIGRDTDKVIRLGDEVKVSVESVDLEKRSVQFTLLENFSDSDERSMLYLGKQKKDRRPGKKKRKR